MVSVAMPLTDSSSLELFITILERDNIQYSSHKLENGQTRLDLQAVTTGVVGYSGFVSEFTFNSDGSLDTVGVWE